MIKLRPHRAPTSTSTSTSMSTANLANGDVAIFPIGTKVEVRYKGLADYYCKAKISRVVQYPSLTGGGPLETK